MRPGRQGESRGRLVIATKLEATRKRLTLRSGPVQEIARELTTLGLVHVKQDGLLNVRQRETLRRALAGAADALAWDVKAATSSDPRGEAVKDLKKLVQAGAQTLKSEVADELSVKKSEEKQLEKVVESLEKLVEKSEKAFPSDLTYFHTARDVTQGFFTKTETLTLNDATEAKDTLQTIQKSLNRWGKLRVQMHEELQQTQKRLGILSGDMTDFIDSSRALLDELLLTLD